MLGGVSGRRALGIGGSRGLGRAVALSLAGAGASVVAVGRSARRLTELRAVARARGVAVAVVRADASRPASLRRLLGRAAGPDLLVVAAGDYWEGPISRLTDARWKALVHSNVSLALAAVREALPGMRRRRYGRILLFGVAGAETPRAAPRAHAYRAAKIALLTLARSIAHEEAGNGITVNVILPGVIQTGLPPRRAAAFARKIPAGRLGAPSEIARAALFLVAEESGYITGAALPVAGGYLL
jgi:gluconate 5-dehydrogenase